MEILKWIESMDREIDSALGEKLTVTKYSIVGGTSLYEGELPNNIGEFYKVIKKLNYEWETKEPMANGEKIYGLMNILEAAKVVRDWEGIVYFKNDDAYGEDIRRFKVVDFFTDEACVGFIPNDQNTDYMQFLDFGEKEAEPLGLDFKGYLEMMFAARGFQYWQTTVLNLANGKGNDKHVEEFKTYMPQIFPDFKWEEFVALYEKVKIK